MRLLLLSLSLFSFAIFAENAKLQLNTYITMQEALANDQLEQALLAHKMLCDKELTKYKNLYKDCEKKFKNIHDLRTSFKTLSQIFISNVSKEEIKKQKLIEAECPMAKAKWIQKEGSIANPYYGKDMLTCGSKVE